MPKAKKPTGNNSTAGAMGRKASPWNRGPNCSGAGARASHMRYVKRGPKQATAAHPPAAALQAGEV